MGHPLEDDEHNRVDTSYVHVGTMATVADHSGQGIARRATAATSAQKAPKGARPGSFTYT